MSLPSTNILITPFCDILQGISQEIFYIISPKFAIVNKNLQKYQKHQVLFFKHQKNRLLCRFFLHNSASPSTIEVRGKNVRTGLL
jgi:hypothetical protein